jgi:acyl-CoA synthetase (AMP-forming)/AMP-acid ligase II
MCLEVARQAAARSTVGHCCVLGPEAEGAEAFAALLTHGDRPPPVEIDPARDVAALLYSSGTTGRPKGVALTHRAMIAALTQVAALAPLTERDRVLCPIPFFHIAGQAVGMNAVLRAGATVVTMPRFDLQAFLALAQEHRTTAVLGAPPIVRALAHHPLVDRYDLSALERVVSGSAPLSATLQTACAQRLGRFVGQAYGLTETGLIIAVAPHDGRPARPGAAGMLCPSTEARVVDPEQGGDVAPGAVGELWVRGPQLTAG